jgi:multiple antibiotic resistance protein
MHETAAVALTTFFATIGPIDVAAMFAALTAGSTPAQRRGMAVEATTKADISVFPLATPLIAGPGAMGAAVLLMAHVEGDMALRGVVLFCMLAVLALQFLLLLVASQVPRLLGVTGLHVISRVFGVLLSALAIQFVFDGIQESGLLP